MITFPKLFGALACLALAWNWMPVHAEDDVAALRAAVAIERVRAPAPSHPRSDFLVRPMVPAVRLSPDGRHVAYLRGQGSDRSLWLLSTSGGAARRLLPSVKAEDLAWSHDGQWLFLESRRSLSSLSIKNGTGVRIALGGAEKRETMMLDPSQPAAMILREQIRSPAGTRWRVVRMDARGKRTLLREDAREILDAVVGAGGRLAFIQRFENDHLAVHRLDAGGRMHEVLRCVRLERCNLLAALPQGELLLRGDVGGNFGRVLKLDASGQLHTLHADPHGESDLDEVVLDPATQQPLVAHYRSIVAASYGLGDAQQHVAAITRHFPQRFVRIAVGSGPDAHWLLSERDSTLQGERYHLYDPRAGRIRSILEQETRASQPLPELVLAHKIPFAYRASDGMRLHGFLLVPPGMDPARVPLIAQPHGGPFNLSRPGYDGIAQLLVNRGYAVFQPNFRGSTGHGRDYMLAARGDFGNGRVQQDIVDGARYLLAQGIGDAQRVGIAGHSFGGYSALQGVTFAPDLFKVGVAGAAPADFGWVMRWNVESGDLGAAPGVPLATTMRLSSIDITDTAAMARLHAQSPIANAGKLRRPLLLIAGGEDRIVPIRGVIHYAAQLRALGKDVSLYVEPEGGHSPTDPLPREAYVYLMEVMLQHYLGGTRPEAPSPKLREYLKKTLRLSSRDIEFLPKQ